VAIAAVALLVVLAVAIVPGVVGDRPAATLRVDPAYAGETPEWIEGNYLRQLGADKDDVVRYQDYEQLQVWASPGGTPQRCVFVAFGERGLWAMNCTPRGLDPTTDVALGPMAVPPSMRDEAPDLPDGTVLRFTLKGDAVEVRVATPDVVDPADS
jgi:hypothetical protein